MYEDFVQLIREEKFRKARYVLDRELTSNPDSVYLLAQMANVLWNMGKGKEALPYVEHGEAIDAEDGLLAYTAGRVFWSLERFKESIVRWDRILESDLQQLAEKGFGKRWALSMQNDARYYKADCLFNLYREAEAEALLREHLDHRRKGLESEFTLKGARKFMKVIEYSLEASDPSQLDDSPAGYSTQRESRRYEKHIKKLNEAKQWKRLIDYLKRKCRQFPKEYWLKSVLSEVLYGERDKDCLRYAEKAYNMASEDMLVVYNYACSLHLNGRNEEAVAALRSIQEKGLDYIAYSEHGEGLRWAKQLMKDTEYLIKTITTKDQ